MRFKNDCFHGGSLHNLCKKLVQFCSYSVFVLLSECHEWPEAPISAFLRQLYHSNNKKYCDLRDLLCAKLLLFMPHCVFRVYWLGFIHWILLNNAYFVPEKSNITVSDSVTSALLCRIKEKLYKICYQCVRYNKKSGITSKTEGIQRVKLQTLHFIKML